MINLGMVATRRARRHRTKLILYQRRTPMQMKSITDKEWFLSRVAQGDGCWMWQRSLDAHGYGQTWFRRKVSKAHRVAWTVLVGEIPEGLHVLHKCDNPPCVNPDHLFLGTNQDNIRDRLSKNRPRGGVRGASHRSAKLSWDQVEEIRRRYIWGNGRALGREFGVTHASIVRIVNKTGWKSPS